MTRGKRICLWSFTGFIAVIAALVVFIATFDWNRVKPTINEKVSAELGRPFAINGDLQVFWRTEPAEGGWRAYVPWPHFSAQDITLGNPDWAAGKTRAPNFASLEKVEFRLAPLPLLWQTVRIPQIVLTRPSADLLRLADGRATWTFELPKKEEDPNAMPEHSSWKLDIGEIGFDKGSVSLDDQSLKTRLELLVDPLGRPVPFGQLAGKALAGGDKAATQDYVFGWKLKGQYKGLPLAGAGKVGGVLALQDAAKPFPVQADVSAGSTRASIVGTLTDPLNLGALDLRLQLAGTSMANLFPLTGVTLPDTPAYETDGRLKAELHDSGGAQFHYENFNGKVGDSDLHGDLVFVNRQPRPKLSGKLRSDQLRMADLGPLIGADSNQEKQARGQSTRQPADKVLPVEEFRTDRWRAMDADVEFTGKRIVHGDKLPISDLYTHLVLNDGLLSLEPLRFGVAGGTLDSHIRLDGGKTPLQSRVQLQARSFKLKELFPSFAPMQSSFGELNGDATIAGTGNSVATILAGANGEMKLLINDGRISRSLMEIAGLNVGNYVVNKLFGDDEVKINCAAADVGIANGLAKPRVFAFDTENAIITVDGTANFATEQLDLDITPQSKGVRIFSLRSPLYVQGTFKNPKAGVHVLPLAARGAGMVALGVAVAPAAALLALIAPSKQDDNQCAALLQQMKQPPKAPTTRK
ncbi:AsmA family protein [Pseudomonas nitroreducens]|uniref:AsmA family protein n=1 Tax=Pseudomonas nitroreducens TaxID=46680 RepID=A0ABS0KQJ5_PSENT|nr:AsmA family protein [Pseudomonas nitroreducens]MBG6290320.1 AsmA family protein [Pseudomonas nitroreducens]